MDLFLTCKKEYGLFVAELSIDQPHCKLTIEICVGSYASYLKVNVLVKDEVCKEAINSLDGDLVSVRFCDFLNQSFSLFVRENGIFHRVVSYSYNEFVTNVNSSVYDVEMSRGRWVERASVEGSTDS